MQDPIYNRIVNTPRPSLLAANGLLLLAVAGLWAETLLEPALRGASVDALNALYYALFLILPVMLYALSRRDHAGAMRFGPIRVPDVLFILMMAFASLFVASGLTDVWDALLARLGLRGTAIVDPPGTLSELYLSLFTMAALPALAEELLFRGLLMGAWEGRGTRFAVLVTTGLFALMHGNLFGLPAYCVVGVTAGALTFALDTVYAGAIYHMVYNAIGLCIAYAGRDLAPVAPTPMQTVWLAGVFLGFAAMYAWLFGNLMSSAEREGRIAVPRTRRPLNRYEVLTLAAALALMLIGLIAVTAASIR